ncbi:eIF-2-alpha kinase GCN2 [Eumeta japonica]|uniref:non-specific serine/threonine protein kinase n=1 Tax=Eumeta variegata TaxID=151549 RepID=A0A4C1U6Z6_EUMVA|nr:eIF-2-alpha kinase GCN2 [Eumeta japonica]
MLKETQECQQDEIETLKAIYGEDLFDNCEATENEVKLTLPLHNSAVPRAHCSVTLCIERSPEYPEKAPNITIEKYHGILDETALKLLIELEALALECCGEVMIFQLIQHVQEFLHNHYKSTSSGCDEMLERRYKSEMHKMYDLQLKESKENQDIKDEIQQRQEVILKNERQQKVQHTCYQNERSDDNESSDTSELISYSDKEVSSAERKGKEKNIEPCTCHCIRLRTLKIHQNVIGKVNIGNCLGRSLNRSTYLGIDEKSGNTLIIKKWCLHSANDLKWKRLLHSIEEDLEIVNRIIHPNVIVYNAMKYQQGMSPKKEIVQYVYLLRDFVFGTSLKYLKTRVYGLGDSLEDLRFVRHIGNGIFNALLELHRSDLMHGEIKPGNVFMDNSGLVKLVDVSFDVRLQHIVENGGHCERQTKTQHIFAAAQLLLSLISDKKTGLEIPSCLESTVKQFFSKCLTEDEYVQWSVENLLNHPFLKDALVRLLDALKILDILDNGRGSVQSDDCSSLPAEVHSRLGIEFETLKWLGKGAFGDVLKVKNKLDGGIYAVKIIKLNPQDVQLNKKIKGEVKLLSSLKHENIVRYYNAWIETTQVGESNDSNEESGYIDSFQKIPEKKFSSEVKLVWSINGVTKSEIEEKDISDFDLPEVDDEDDDHNDEEWEEEQEVLNITDCSCSIEFEVDTHNKSEIIPSGQTIDSSRSPTEHQVLYIQMEFCEKNTLRHAIDSGLYLEHFRAWRLFREIVEGLAHVHQRGMIHRDLKPDNVFLDLNDHVKIGDFGLATKAFPSLLGSSDDKNKTQYELGGSLTGQVGTALYVAPELLQAANKVIYNQKVDIYSLGIILFEIFHAPFDTGMERIKVLTELRSKDIHLPSAFVSDENKKQIHVIRWLLHHDPSLRPTCAELLSSEHVPRAVPEGALAGLVAHALAEKGGHGRRKLVKACLKSTVTPAEDYNYDSGLKSEPDVVLLAVKDSVIEVFKRHAAIEFAPPLMLSRTGVWDKHHTAVKLLTASGSVVHLPHDLRLPFARRSPSALTSKISNRSGGLAHQTHISDSKYWSLKRGSDMSTCLRRLRYPPATTKLRYTAYKESVCMRRYVVDRVFREKHVPGFHPRELLECAFDIVTPKTSSLWPDAELLLIVCAAAARVGLKLAFQMNHIMLLRGVLMACGIPMDKHADLYPLLVDMRTVRSGRALQRLLSRRNAAAAAPLGLARRRPGTEITRKKIPSTVRRITSQQLQIHLTSLCLNDSDVINLLLLMQSNVPINAIRELLVPVMRRSESNEFMEKAIAELEICSSNAKAFGAECLITIAPCLAYNASQHDGVFWQALYAQKQDQSKAMQFKYRTGDLIAAGGRYNTLVEDFWKVTRSVKGDKSKLKSCSVGFSMSLERIAAIIKKGGINLPEDLKSNIEQSGKICVCIWGAAGSGRDCAAASRRAGLARELWAAGCTVCVAECRGTGEAHELTGANLVALLTDDSANSVRLAQWDKTRLQEKILPLSAVVDYVKQKLQMEMQRNSETPNRSRSSSPSEMRRPPILATVITHDKLSNKKRRRLETQDECGLLLLAGDTSLPFEINKQKQAVDEVYSTISEIVEIY